MVLRVFVQPGEGKAWIHPKRSEPLAANATPTYALLSSSALAAAYTSYARHYAQTRASSRVPLQPTVSSTANLFIRSSAKAGIWCAVTGAAVNWYYHKALATPIIHECGVRDTEWKLWEKSEGYTVDDGMVAGAATGLAIGLLSSAFLRFRTALLPKAIHRDGRTTMRWWTRCIGLTNIGAAAGILASNAYFRYTGDRQKAVAALEQWNRRRAFEFHYIYWNKTVLTSLSPVAQAYVLFNGIFQARLLPEEVLDDPQKYGFGIMSQVTVSPTRPNEAENANLPATSECEESRTGTPTEPFPPSFQPTEKYELLSHYMPLEDYPSELTNISIPHLKDEIRDRIAERQRLLQESEFIGRRLAQAQYEVCHTTFADEDEKVVKLREVHLLKIMYNNLRLKADLEDRNVFHAMRSLVQREAMDSGRSSDDAASESQSSNEGALSPPEPKTNSLTWTSSHQHSDTPDQWSSASSSSVDLPSSPPLDVATDFEQQGPTKALQYLDEYRMTFEKEILMFEDRIRSPESSAEMRERARLDLEDARAFLRAADRLCWVLERERDDGVKGGVEVKVEDGVKGDEVKLEMEMVVEGDEEEKKGIPAQAVGVDKPSVDKTQKICEVNKSHIPPGDVDEKIPKGNEATKEAKDIPPSRSLEPGKP